MAATATNWQTIGHDKAIAALTRGAADGRVAHAYLIVGPPNSGKMTLAMDIARMVNCSAPSAAEKPCGECRQCDRVTRALHADVRVIAHESGGSSTRSAVGVDQIRELQKEANLKPYEGKYRVFIIDGAELFTQEAANALLKILEEPPADVIFALLAVEARGEGADESAAYASYRHSGAARRDRIAELLDAVPRVGGVLPTIVSRCQVLELRPLPVALVADEIERRFDAPPPLAQEIARLSGGRMGLAMRFAASPDPLAQRNERLDEIEEALGAGLAERFAYAERQAAAFAKERGAVYDELDLWLSWWRDALVVKEGCPEFAANLSRMDALQTAAAACSSADAAAAVRAAQETAAMLEANVNARLALEGMMLRMPQVALPAGKAAG